MSPPPARSPDANPLAGGSSRQAPIAGSSSRTPKASPSCRPSRRCRARIPHLVGRGRRHQTDRALCRLSHLEITAVRYMPASLTNGPMPASRRRISSSLFRQKGHPACLGHGGGTSPGRAAHATRLCTRPPQGKPQRRSGRCMFNRRLGFWRPPAPGSEPGRR